MTTTLTERYLPYGRQTVTDDDVKAVVDVLRSDFLTQGPAVETFERALAEKIGAREVVTCANGTAALHLAMLSLGLQPGQAVLTTPNTFVATANAARYVGAEVEFADINPTTGLIDVAQIEQALELDLQRRIKVIAPVHFAGQPVDMPAVRKLAEKHRAWVVEDACHALGATYEAESQLHTIGSCQHSDMTVFSFHPVKHVAAGEGGAIATNDTDLADRLRRLRNHGLTKTDFLFENEAFAHNGDINPWYYELPYLGYNYRLSDIHAALGATQLSRLDESVARRNELALFYNRLITERFAPDEVRSLKQAPGVRNAYHLYVVLIDFDRLGTTRADVMNALRERSIGTQVHYIPVSSQPYYRNRYNLNPNQFMGAAEYYRQALTLPLFPEMNEQDVERVVDQLATVLRGIA